MSCDWVRVPLSSLGKIVTGKTPPSKVTDAFVNGNVPFVTPRDLDDRKWIKTTERYLSNTGLESVKGNIVPAHSVAVSCIGSDMGKARLLSVKSVTNQQINTILVNSELHNPEYIYYVLSTKQQSLKDIAGGSATPILNKSHFGQFEIDLPSKGYQDAVVDVLRGLDSKIEINTQTNETLEEMAQAIFKSWFVDFDPVKAKMNGEQPEGMDAATASLFPDKLVESELGLIPEGWDIASIKDFGDVICGKTPSKKNADFYGGDVPFIKIPDTHGKVFITETTDTLTKAGDASQPKKRIPENSICVSCIATVGQVFITTQPSHTNQQINSVVPNNKNSLYYLLFTFKGLHKHFHDLASGGSATLNMNTSTFSKVALVRPTVDLLEAFHKTVGGLMEKMLANQLENSTLSELRDTLLPKLLSGEIELGTSEELVEAI